MSEPTYTFTLTESERLLLANVFGLFARKMANTPILIVSPRGVRPWPFPTEPSEQNPPAHHASANSPSQAPPAAAQSAPTANPIALRDRWARDRKGNEVPNPEGCYPADVHLWKTEQKEKYLRITWESSNGSGFADANCFDQKLWPWILQAKAAGQKTRLYLVVKGKYLNVVGIKA